MLRSSALISTSYSFIRSLIPSTIEVMDKKLTTIHQHPQDLILAITSPKHEMDLTILEETSVICHDWELTFTIIGESHRVRFQHPHSSGLQEVFACIDISADNCQHVQSFHQLEAHTYSQLGYTAHVSFSPHPPWKLPSPDNPHLIYDFPEVYNQIPRTAIYWACSAEEVTWWTLHTYINVNHITYVHTKSQFQFSHFERS